MGYVGDRVEKLETMACFGDDIEVKRVCDEHSSIDERYDYLGTFGVYSREQEKSSRNAHDHQESSLNQYQKSHHHTVVYHADILHGQNHDDQRDAMV